jgi:penicillin-binding protein 1A
MAGYDHPGGPGWPGPGYPEQLGGPPPARPRGPVVGGYGLHDQPDLGPGDPYDDYADDWEAEEWESEPLHRPSRDDHTRKAGRRRRNILWRWRRGLFVAALVVMALVAAGVSAVAQVELPDATEMQLSSFICTAEVGAGHCQSSTALARLSGEGNSEYIRLEDVPQVVIDAVIAAEDRSFFEHDGLDPVGIGRALYRDLRGGGLSQGGSTITQQFVKNVYLESERTLTRKIREAVLAIKVEQEMSKEEILEGYLNTIYWGRNAYGLRAAVRAYFNMDLSDPNFGLEEASYLAGLIRSPTLADAGDPEHPEQLDEATRRRSTVLDAMVEEGYIDQAAQDMVEAIDLSTYVVPKSNYRLNTTIWGGGAEGWGLDYVTEYVRQVARRTLVNDLEWSEDQADQELASGGLRIYTTIDRTMQQHAYNAVYREVLNDPAVDPSAGLVAIDNQGMIKAMVGGRDYYADNNFAQNNFAVMGEAGRQVGSTFKPFALAVAADRAVSFERTSLPAPSELELDPIPETQCESRTYRNYSSEDADTGSLNLFEATAESSNTAFVGLMYELGSLYGPEAVPEMAEELGMDGALSQERLSQCLPTVLGSEGSSPLEMAEMYSTFANRGVHKEPTIITRIDRVSPGGDVANLWTWQANEDPVLTQEAADLVTYALQGVVDHGTGTAAAIGRDVAGKTGTTSLNKDAWFVGYVPQLTAAVWMGYAEANWTDPECNPAQTDTEAEDYCRVELPPMRSGDGFQGTLHGHSTITGGSLPAQIWATFMTAVTANLPVEEFVEPSQEVRQAGQALGDGIDQGAELPAETPPPTPPVTGPSPTISVPPVTEPPESTTTTDTTLFPFPTSTTTEPPPDGRPDPP